MSEGKTDDATGGTLARLVLDGPPKISLLPRIREPSTGPTSSIYSHPPCLFVTGFSELSGREGG